MNILRRLSMMSAANMISNASDGNILVWKIKIWTELRPALKDSLDSKNSTHLRKPQDATKRLCQSLSKYETKICNSGDMTSMVYSNSSWQR